jgi:hypothetical protein
MRTNQEDPMKRMTTLIAVMLFAFLGAPLAALADHHEAGEKAKADANANPNAQWSEDAKKGQERAAEVKAGAKVDAGKAEADAKATADKAKGNAKAKTDKETTDAAAKANAAAGGANAKAKGAIDAAVPGMGAGAEVEAGAGAK